MAASLLVSKLASILANLETWSDEIDNVKINSNFLLYVSDIPNTYGQTSAFRSNCTFDKHFQLTLLPNWFKLFSYIKLLKHPKQPFQAAFSRTEMMEYQNIPAIDISTLNTFPPQSANEQGQSVLEQEPQSPPVPPPTKLVRFNDRIEVRYIEEEEATEQ